MSTLGKRGAAAPRLDDTVQRTLQHTVAHATTRYNTLKHTETHTGGGEKVYESTR